MRRSKNTFRHRRMHNSRPGKNVTEKGAGPRGLARGVTQPSAVDLVFDRTFW